MMGKSWIPSDILEILLICWHAPSRLGGNCEPPKSSLVKRAPGVRGAEKTKGNLWKKGFCSVSETNCLRKEIREYPSGCRQPSAPCTLLRWTLPSMKPRDPMRVSWPAPLGGGGCWGAVCGPLRWATGSSCGEHWTCDNKANATLSQSKSSEVNTHTHTHTHCAVS